MYKHADGLKRESVYFMKKYLSLMAILLVLSFAFVSCDGFTIIIQPNTTTTNSSATTTKPVDGDIRTTIADYEWYKMLYMQNYTITLEISIYPDFKQVTMVTENALKVNNLPGDSFYYVNENGSFYNVSSVEGIWCKYRDVVSDSSFSFFTNQFNVNARFEDLVYDEETKAYLEYTEINGEEFCNAYNFENGVLTQIKCHSITDDITAFYFITDIDNTVVTVPEYIPLSSYYALKVMPNGGGFEEIDISNKSMPTTIKEAHKAINGGYVFKVEFTGYNHQYNIVAFIGVDSNGKVTGTNIIEEYENLGSDPLHEYDATGKFHGVDYSTIDGVDTVARATISTKAYRSAVKDALKSAIILEGGDLRTEEEKYRDNVYMALPSADCEFIKHFFVEVIEGVDAIYVAKNLSGFVVVIGDEFIGLDFDGKVLNGTNKVAENAIATLKATKSTKIDLSTYSGISKRVKSAKITNAGVYILEVEGSGYGINGNFGSGEYLIINISIAPDGSILDCRTVYQNETDGFGSVCGDEKFYNQFSGKTEDNYNDVIIAGATYTTNGYHNAIKNAYKAIEIIKAAE